VIFGKRFNQMVDNLSENTAYVRFGNGFNQYIDNLPESIKEMGFYSHHNFKNNIPSNVEIINVYFHNDNRLNKSVENVPPTIKKIRINTVSKKNFITKIPFCCEVVDEFDNKIK
jgi:hypothetical protein